MKTRRLQYQYRSNASKLHKQIGELLRTSSYFKNYRVYQEYPVQRINPSFPDGRCKFDWVVLDLKLVIEAHGQQHYQVCTFGMDPEEAIASFKGIQQRDQEKAEAARQAGFTYIVVPYYDAKKLNESYILDQIDVLSVSQQVEVKPSKREIQKSLARIARRKQYAYCKELKKQYKLRQQENQDNG